MTGLWTAGAAASDGGPDLSAAAGSLTTFLTACFFAAGGLGASAGACAVGAFCADWAVVAALGAAVGAAGAVVVALLAPGLLAVEVGGGVSSDFLLLLHPAAAISNRMDRARAADLIRTGASPNSPGAVLPERGTRCNPSTRRLTGARGRDAARTAAGAAALPQLLPALASAIMPWTFWTWSGGRLGLFFSSLSQVASAPALSLYASRRTIPRFNKVLG